VNVFVLEKSGSSAVRAAPREAGVQTVPFRGGFGRCRCKRR